MYYENFEKLCNLKSVKPSTVSKATGISTATLTSWKQGKYTPKQDKLQLIADYFGVTIDYLMTGEEKEGGETYYLNDETREIAQAVFENPDLRSLFDVSRKMSPERLKAHIEFMKKMQAEENKSVL